jgi:hypothetical protein
MVMNTGWMRSASGPSSSSAAVITWSSAGQTSGQKV